MDDLGDASADGTTGIIWEELVKGEIRSEDLLCSRRDVGGSVATVNVASELGVDQVDTGFSWEMGKAHIIEDDAVVPVRVEVPETVHMANDQWIGEE